MIKILNIHKISLYEDINKKVYILPKHFVLGFYFLAEFYHLNVKLPTVKQQFSYENYL